MTLTKCASTLWPAVTSISTFVVLVAAVGAAASPLDMTVSTAQDSYTMGDPISLAVILHNGGTKPLPVTAVPASIYKAAIKRVDSSGRRLTIKPTKGRLIIEPASGGLRPYSAGVLQPGESSAFVVRLEFTPGPEANYRLKLKAKTKRPW